MLVIASQQIDSGNVVTWYQALDFIQNSQWVKRTHLGFQAVRLQPYCVPISLSGLRSARLSHVGACTGSEGHQLANVEFHGIADADNDFEVRFGVTDLAGLFQQLQVAAGIGESTRLF